MKHFLIMLLLVISFTGCKKQVDNSEHLIYQSAASPVSSSLFGAHVSRAVEIKENNSLVEQLVASDEFRENGLPVEQLQMDQIKKYNYDISAIAAIEIPVANEPEKKLIGFYYNGKFAVTFVTITGAEGAKQTFTQSDRDGNIFQTIDFTEGNGLKILGFTNPRPLPFDRLKNNSARSVDLVNPESPITDDPTCYTKTKGAFKACMTCAINECAGEFPCNALCMLVPAPCLIGFGIACAGVGPK